MSNNALKSSESKLFNAGSTIKIRHFLDDIKSSEIKVEIQKFLTIWKVSIFASTKFTFRKQINENEIDHLENRTEIEPYQASVNYVRLKCDFLSLSHLQSSALKINQIPTLQFEAICHSKTEKSWFWPSIWRNFTSWNLKIIDIPSMKQNNAKFGHFVGFPKFGGIIEICRIFLKGNETFQLFFEGVVELWICQWENAFFENPNCVKSRQNRVISAENLTLNSQ